MRYRVPRDEVSELNSATVVEAQATPRGGELRVAPKQGELDNNKERLDQLGIATDSKRSESHKQVDEEKELIAQLLNVENSWADEA